MKTWIKPQGIVEEFVANEYVAACGDIKFVCYDTGFLGKTYFIDSNRDGSYSFTEPQGAMYHDYNETLVLPAGSTILPGWLGVAGTTTASFYYDGRKYHASTNVSTIAKS